MKLTELKNLIKESYVKKQCNCGCGGCNKAPILTENKVKSLLSEGLQYHISKKVPLHETIYRYGSEKHLMLIKEARRMYSRGVIDLSEDDKQLVSTNLGEFALYEGVEVPLDLPMVNEEKVEATYAGRPVTVIKVNPTDETTWKVRFANGKEVDFADTIANIKFNEDLGENIDKVTGGFPYKVEGGKAIISTWMPDESKERIIKRCEDAGYDCSPNQAGGVTIMLKKGTYESLDEEKKDPPIGKPKRGGSKAYYVYVRDPKTKRIKKVSFGSGGLRAKIKDPKARSAFAKRHRCSEKNDRTKPSYWSCRLPRYAQALGLGSNSNTFW